MQDPRRSAAERVGADFTNNGLADAPIAMPASGRALRPREHLAMPDPGSFHDAPDAGDRRATLAAGFARSGRGLHTGRHADVRVEPAASGHGIVFRRRLRGGTADVPALWRYRERQPLCTALRVADGPLVRTVEHLLAALYAHRIDDALIELDAEELPIFDGSARPWCEAIRAAGRTQFGTARQRLRVLSPVEVRDGRRSLSIEPADALHISGSLALAHFGEMHWSGAITPDGFDAQVAPSRSFGRLKWALPAKIYGLVARKPLLRGANLSTTAAIVGGRVVGGMRVPDEPVRHRVLDLVGDLSLAGYPVLGRLTAVHTGHELNHALVAKLMTEPTAWELV